MKQINLHASKEFLSQLRAIMRLKGIKTQSETIRFAIQQTLARLTAQKPNTDFRSWLGVGLKIPPRRRERFQSQDDLWKS